MDAAFSPARSRDLDTFFGTVLLIRSNEFSNGLLSHFGLPAALNTH